MAPPKDTTNLSPLSSSDAAANEEEASKEGTRREAFSRLPRSLFLPHRRSTVDLASVSTSDFFSGPDAKQDFLWRVLVCTTWKPRRGQRLSEVFLRSVSPVYESYLCTSDRVMLVPYVSELCKKSGYFPRLDGYSSRLWVFPSLCCQTHDLMGS